MGRTSHADVLAELDGILSALPPGDHELQARAHLSRAWMLNWLGRVDEAIAGGKTAIDDAARAGLPAIEYEAAGMTASAMRWGATPWHEVLRFIDDRLATGGVRPGSRVGAEVRDFRPAALAALGNLELARAEFAQRRSELLERGAVMFLHRLAMDEGWVELQAGEFERAAVIFEGAWHGLSEAGEHGFRSTIGTMLAEALARLGRIDEAELLIDESGRLAVEDDAATEVGVARARAHVAAVRGLHEEAIAFTREAIGLADATDYLEERADLYLTLGEALLAAGRAEEAADALRTATELAEQKGSIALAEHARTRLAALQPG
jgi:tetratricopeptide (TPR) repeat protein